MEKSSVLCPRCGGPTVCDEKNGPACPEHGPIQQRSDNIAFDLSLRPLYPEELRGPDIAKGNRK